MNVCNIAVVRRHKVYFLSRYVQFIHKQMLITKLRPNDYGKPLCLGPTSRQAVR